MPKNELAILGLQSEGEKHGCQIHQEIRERNMDTWARISVSSIYNTLTELKERGMVSAKRMRIGSTPERRGTSPAPGERRKER